jgi:predicted Zn-dependent peptidase
MNRMAHNELFYGRAHKPEEVLAEVDAVSLESVRQLATDLFEPSRFTTVVVGPLRKLPKELAWLNAQVRPAYVTLEA